MCFEYLSTWNEQVSKSNKTGHFYIVLMNFVKLEKLDIGMYLVYHKTKG